MTTDLTNNVHTSSNKHHYVSFTRTRRSQKPGTRLQSHSSAPLLRVSVCEHLAPSSSVIPMIHICRVICLTQLFFCFPSMCAGMLSHQLKQHVIDGEKTIIQNPTDQQKWVHSASVSCHWPDECLTSGWSRRFVFVERTTRRLSLRCMRYMQWMCWSALERGRWEGTCYAFVFSPLNSENSIKARN